MATIEEQYMLRYFDSLRLLRAKLDELEEAAIDAARTDAQRAEAAAAYLDLSSQIGLFKAAHEALMATWMLAGVEPPGAKLVEKAAELAKKLGEQIAKKKKYKALLKGVSDIVNAWAAMSSPTAATPGASSNLAFIGKA